MILVPGGGAIARVDENAMAFGQRNAPWNMHYLSMGPDAADDDRNIAYTRDIAAAMKPWTSGDQGHMGSDQLVSPQPEHPAELIGADRGAEACKPAMAEIRRLRRPRVRGCAVGGLR